MEFSNVEAIKRCVASGLGVALLPAVCLENERRAGDITTVPWKEKDFSVLTQMVRRKERWVSPALAAFMDTAREVLGPAE